MNGDGKGFGHEKVRPPFAKSMAGRKGTKSGGDFFTAKYAKYAKGERSGDYFAVEFRAQIHKFNCIR
jgi:hypothetical protein